MAPCDSTHPALSIGAPGVAAWISTRTAIVPEQPPDLHRAVIRVQDW